MTKNPADMLTKRKPLASEPYHRRRTRLFWHVGPRAERLFFFVCTCMASIENSALASKQRAVSWEEGGLPMANTLRTATEESGVLESVRM